jgi:hypothetical protein
MVPQATES